MSHIDTFFSEVEKIASIIDTAKIEQLVNGLVHLRENGGRLFLIGVGGSAGNCSHAVNDFRKLCGIEAYSPVDNVSELTARANDEGWDTIFSGWLEISRACANDAILVFSVGGGDAKANVSTNIVNAVDYAKSKNMKVYGIVGRESGHTARNGDVVIVVPVIDQARITPHSEAFQAVIWHSMVSHPDLQIKKTKW